LVILLEKHQLPADRPLVERALQALRRSGKSTLPRGFTLVASGDVVSCVPPSEEGEFRLAARPPSLA
jgi:hypothetical protein